MTPKRKEPDLSTYSGRVAARLRMLRDRAGLHAEEVVEKMSKAGFPATLQAYYAWESGRAKLNLDAVPALLIALKLKTAHSLFPKS